METQAQRPPDWCSGKRRQILDGARRVFAELGYERASVDLIAAGAGVSKATLYNHFHDKSALFIACFEEGANLMQADLEALFAETSDDLESALQAAGERMLAKFLSREAVALYRSALDGFRLPEIGKMLYERGARLTQQLLLLARAEGAVLDGAWRAQRVDLARLATGAADRWLQPSLQAGQDLGFDLQPAWVEGDALLLAELLGNLLHNAIEHAGRGACITVRTRTHDGTAELSVEDDGPGIAPSERSRLWQRFQRGREAVGTGSGLGLAIVRDIARLHGAAADLELTASGRGLCVRVRFAQSAADRPSVRRE
jgi:signal transduction histidine kinase